MIENNNNKKIIFLLKSILLKWGIRINLDYTLSGLSFHREMRYFIDQNATHISHAHFKTAEMILSFNSNDLSFLY